MRKHILIIILTALSFSQISLGAGIENNNDNEKEIEKLRKKLASDTNNPENITDEYRLATLIRHRIDPETQQYIVTDETKQLFEKIVEKYNHMDYYSTDLPNHPRSEQIIVPESAVIAASYQKDIKKARSYYYKALECLYQTYTKRKKDWQTAPTPEKPSQDNRIGGSREIAKWESRMSVWKQKKEDAEEGNVLHDFELSIVKRAVKSYLSSYIQEYGNKNDPSSNRREIINASTKLMNDFPDTPISDYAFEYSEIIVDVLEKVRIVTK